MPPPVLRAALSGESVLDEGRDDIKDAELILTAFRTLILLAIFAAPSLLGVGVAYTSRQIALAALAGIYNIAMGVASLSPQRYGVRRPFVLAMDIMLITVWIHFSERWELFPFFYIVVVVAAMWFRVLGGILAAALCDFLYLFLWGRLAADFSRTPPPFTGAMAINIALLFMVGCLAGYIAEAQERERERRLERELLISNYQNEMDVSSQLQPLLMSRVEGADPCLEVGAALHSARLVGGGDYLDALPLSDGCTLLCIADVAGKSVRAQARVPLLKYSLRALAPLYPKPDELAERLQEVLAPDLQPELYIAACLIVLDAEDQKLTWCNAGHIAPLLVRKNGVVLALETTNPALGLFPEVAPEAKTMSWRPGDALLLFTDGLADALSYGGTEDGEEQIRILAAKLGGESAPPSQDAAQELVDLAEAVLDDKPILSRFFALAERSGNVGTHRDDVAVLVARHL